ncbi:siphovirus ReqiPepy6 Gp37-like family protein [Polymorphospora lycopeni]|uniref:Siphovirus ReqiPepy6 Gp37-like family protein n=1 Tax=Polymorphospora lycopeni TaxID=3140240 RepID=A0ABV5CL43_9ACTN
MAITLLVTDRNLNVVGDPIIGWTDLDVTLRFNEPASGNFSAPAYLPLMQQIRGGGYRIIVIRDGQVFCAGPIEKRGPEKWSVDGQDSNPGTITVSFSDDLALAVARATYPDPSQPATAQTSVARWTASGSAETILRSLFNLNAGPGALAARRVPKLVLGPVAGVGSNIVLGTRFEPLGDAARTAALAGGGLGFRTQQVGQQVELQVYGPTDRSRSVRFSRGLGNLREYEYDETAATVTAAIVGGKDEGTSRVIVERLNAAAIADGWRLEAFKDQRQSDDDAGDTTELDQAGDEALAEGAQTARLSAVTIDVPTQRYGVHYGLGDIVSIELTSGVEVTDVVRAVQLKATPETGELVSALIGSQEASSDPLWLTYTRDIARRLARLEAR